MYVKYLELRTINLMETIIILAFGANDRMENAKIFYFTVLHVIHAGGIIVEP